MRESKVLSDYPIRKILRCLMFRNGDAEFPMEGCIDFVADIVIPHVQNIVQKTFEAANKRNSKSPEIIDIVCQFRQNRKLLKRLYEYVSLVKASSNIGKLYDSDINSVNEDEDCAEIAETIVCSSNIGEKVLNAIKTFDVDGELIEFVTSDAADTAKIERNKKIAVRTASMTKEKYSRFAEASSYSFFLVGGKRSDTFTAGFRYYSKANAAFDYDMLIILNFCAIEMTTVLVESAFAKLRQENPGKDLAKLGAIQLEHYQAAAKRIPPKKS